MRQSISAALCLVVIAGVACHCTPHARAAAEHLHISDRTVERQERLIFDPATSPRAHLGNTSAGPVFCGLANPDGSVELWQLGQEIEQDRKINVAATRLTGLSRNGRDLWVATRDGLYRVAGEGTEPLKQVLYPFVITVGPPGDSPPTYHTSGDADSIGVAVASEMPWVALTHLGVRTYIPACGSLFAHCMSLYGQYSLAEVRVISHRAGASMLPALASKLRTPDLGLATMSIPGASEALAGQPGSGIQNSVLLSLGRIPANCAQK